MAEIRSRPFRESLGEVFFFFLSFFAPSHIFVSTTDLFFQQMHTHCFECRMFNHSKPKLMEFWFIYSRKKKVPMQPLLYENLKTSTSHSLIKTNTKRLWVNTNI